MSIIQLSYMKILAEIAEKVGVEMPTCEVTISVQGGFAGCVTLQVVRSGTAVETIRCWGSPSPDYVLALEDATRVAIQRMKSKLSLEIRDVNYDDCLVYKSLYDSVTAQNADLFGELHSMKCEHNLLKDCCASAISEKNESLAEQSRLCRMIDECHVTIGRLQVEQGCAATDLSETGSTSS